jgi:tetratricopeptide (TPR) repeat protein
MKRIPVSALLMVLMLQVASAQTPEARFSEANNLYTSGDYSGAAALYKKLYQEGLRSDNLLYNAGNAYFKAGDVASAILFFERARLISPADEDINYNLQIARSRVSDKFDEVPPLFFVRWFDFVSLLTTTNSWAVIAITLFILSLAAAIFFLTKSRSGGRLLTFWLAVASLILSLISVSLSLRNNSLVNHNTRAVVMCSILTGKSAPGEGGSELFVIHSGTTVVVEESLGEYSEIMLPDGTKGWIKADCIEKI